MATSAAHFSVLHGAKMYRCVSRSASRTAAQSPSPPVTVSLMHAHSEVQSADFTE